MILTHINPILIPIVCKDKVFFFREKRRKLTMLGEDFLKEVKVTTLC